MFHFKSSPTVCYCINVDEECIINAINNGADSLAKVKKMTKACTGNECAELNPSGKCCSKDIKELIKLHTKAKHEKYEK